LFAFLLNNRPTLFSFYFSNNSFCANRFSAILPVVPPDPVVINLVGRQK